MERDAPSVTLSKGSERALPTFLSATANCGTSTVCGLSHTNTP